MRSHFQDGHEKGLRDGHEKGLQQGLEEGRERGLEEGLQQGLEEGREEGKVRIARKLLGMGLSAEQVEAAIGLTNHEIKELLELEMKAGVVSDDREME